MSLIDNLCGNVLGQWGRNSWQGAQQTQNERMELLAAQAQAFNVYPAFYNPRPMYLSDIIPTPGLVIDQNGKVISRYVVEGDL